MFVSAGDDHGRAKVVAGPFNYESNAFSKAFGDPLKMVRPDGLFALRAHPYRGRPSGDRHRRCAALSSNRLVVCRRFELFAQSFSVADGEIMPRNKVRPDGFEPPTPWFEARYSIQLSYGRRRAV
jgi:hypothetical protein